MGPRKVCQLAWKGQARSHISRRDLSLPGDPGKEGLFEGSWLTNFLPLVVGSEVGRCLLNIHQSRKTSIHTPRIWILGSGKGPGHESRPSIPDRAEMPA